MPEAQGGPEGERRSESVQNCSQDVKRNACEAPSCTEGVLGSAMKIKGFTISYCWFLKAAGAGANFVKGWLEGWLA